MMDTQSTIILIFGSVTWISVVFIEAFIESNKMIPPCQITMRYTGYNFIFIAFPITLILIAEIQLMQKSGALGLTCLLETFCLLGINGFEQIRGLHVPFCIIAGLSHTLVCFNIERWIGVFAGTPLLFLSVVYLILPPKCIGKTYYGYIESLIFWGLDIWIALSRIALVWATPSDWVDHYWFDVISSSALTLILLALSIWARSTFSLPNDNWMRKLFYQEF
jgi:hypothetical protein